MYMPNTPFSLFVSTFIDASRPGCNVDAFQTPAGPPRRTLWSRLATLWRRWAVSRRLHRPARADASETGGRECAALRELSRRLTLPPMSV